MLKNGFVVAWKNPQINQNELGVLSILEQNFVSLVPNLFWISQLQIWSQTGYQQCSVVNARHWNLRNRVNFKLLFQCNFCVWWQTTHFMKQTNLGRGKLSWNFDNEIQKWGNLRKHFFRSFSEHSKRHC